MYTNWIIASTRYHDIIERRQISLTSLSNWKIISRTNQGTSEGPETPEQEYLTRRIQFCLVYFYLHIIWKVILKKEVKMDGTKIYQAYLDSPRWELSNDGLGFVVALAVFFSGNHSIQLHYEHPLLLEGPVHRPYIGRGGQKTLFSLFFWTNSPVWPCSGCTRNNDWRGRSK